MMPITAHQQENMVVSTLKQERLIVLLTHGVACQRMNVLTSHLTTMPSICSLILTSVVRTAARHNMMKIILLRYTQVLNLSTIRQSLRAMLVITLSLLRL